MILVTVGTQLPFSRLIAAMDHITDSLEEKVIAQIGSQSEKPLHMETVAELTPVEFEKYMSNARVIVSHVGGGTILTAQRLKKPLIVFPRQAKLLEHRNDHQLDTARNLDSLKGIYVAWTEVQLEELVQRNDLIPAGSHNSKERVQLVNRLKLFIDE
ncbi:MAG: glycosyl transferase family 28 [Methylococcales bacterium]|nr:glycosyl transferase family 28 [Methylococcales bacterium]